MHISRKAPRIGTAVAAGILAVVAPLAALNSAGHHAPATSVRAGAAAAVVLPSDDSTPAAPLDVTWGP